MADIDVQRKSSTAWLWWLLGLVALAMLIWVITAGDDNVEVASAPVAAAPGGVAEVPPPPAGTSPSTAVAPATGIPVSQIVGSPATWTGRTVAGEVRVTEVPTDRGFWITEQGERLFVILGDQPAERPIDIQSGQTLRISEAMVYGSENLQAIPGALDADTRSIAQGQPVVLFADEKNIQILGAAAG